MAEYGKVHTRDQPCGVFKEKPLWRRCSECGFGIERHPEIDRLRFEKGQWFLLEEAPAVEHSE